MVSVAQIETLLPELRSYAGSIVSAHEEADDLVQDAMERALKSKNTPVKTAELRPWLFRILRNLYYDELRKRRVRREYSEEQSRLSNEANTATDEIRNIMIRLAFDKLPPDTKEVLQLVDVLGLKYAEAAEVMGVPVGTIMSRVSRARRALIEQVGDMECGVDKEAK